jgi:hypothetical protein
VYIGGGVHLPSGPAGLPATARYSSSQATSATVMHHGTLLGRVVGPGSGATLGSRIDDDVLRAAHEDAFEKADDVLTNVGCIVTIMVVVTCIVLPLAIVKRGTGSILPIEALLGWEEGLGALLGLGTVVRVLC